MNNEDTINNTETNINNTETNINNINERELKIYVLKCQEGKYYIGKTYNFMRRYDDHLSGKGAFWTRRYRPIEIVELVGNVDKFDEDKYVWKYMEKYGIENVRGGSYSQMILNEGLICCANRHLKSAGDLCYKCSQRGHFYNNCPIILEQQKSHIKDTQNNHEIQTIQNNKENENEGKRKNNDNNNDNNDDSDNEPPRKKRKLNNGLAIIECSRCKRKGHYGIQCYAKRDIYGRLL